MQIKNDRTRFFILPLSFTSGINEDFNQGWEIQHKDHNITTLFFDETLFLFRLRKYKSYWTTKTFPTITVQITEGFTAK